MKMNSLEKIYNALYYEVPEITIPQSVHERALRALNNMLTVS